MSEIILKASTKNYWKFFGYLNAVIVGLATAFLGVAVKSASSDFESPEILLYRSFWMTIFLLPFVFGELRFTFNSKSKYLWGRSIFGALGVLCFFVALKLAPISTAILLYSISPIFVLLFAFLFLNEKLSPIQISGASVVCIGVLALRHTGIDGLNLKIMIIGLLGAFFAALAFLMLRMVAQTHKPKVIVFAVSAATVLVSLPLCKHPIAVITTSNYEPMVWVLVASFFAQFFLTITYKQLGASIAVIITQTSILWAAYFDSIIFDRYFSLFEWIIYTVIIIGLILAVRGYKRVRLPC